MYFYGVGGYPVPKSRARGAEAAGNLGAELDSGGVRDLGQEGRTLQEGVLLPASMAATKNWDNFSEVSKSRCHSNLRRSTTTFL